MKHREAKDIYAEILQACCSPPKKVTEILIAIRGYGGHYIQYVRYLVSVGLLTKDGRKYLSTEKGKKWLEQFMAFKQLEKQLETVYVCVNCGGQFRLQTHLNYCPSCGKQVKEEWKETYFGVLR